MEFLEDLLFTHRGLSGPAVLQISSYWREGSAIRLNLAPGVELPAALARAKATSRKLLANELAQLVPNRLAEAWVQQDSDWQRPVAEVSDKALARLAERLSRWEITPTGTEGYRKAEVTLGGVDTRDLSSQTMASKQPGLYFIGEVVDSAATTSSGPGPVPMPARRHCPSASRPPPCASARCPSSLEGTVHRAA